MGTHPPEWFVITAPLIFAAAFNVALCWQPEWMHRLFSRLVQLIDRTTRRSPEMLD